MNVRMVDEVRVNEHDHNAHDVQILFSLCIFAAGGYRIVQGAKWAIGVEMVYAILVLINAFLGLFAGE